MQAKGVQGALFEPEALPADRSLIANSVMAAKMFSSATIDPFTGQVTSMSTFVRAALVHDTFVATTGVKNKTASVKNVVNWVCSGVDEAIGSVSGFMSSVNKQIGSFVRELLQSAEAEIYKGPLC